jgi:uncharacterized protein with PIN domain
MSERRADTKSHSEVYQGGEEEASQAYVAIRRGASDLSVCGHAHAGDANADRRLKATWYEGSAKEIRFLVNGMLGTLARNLRMLGFDAEYDSGDLTRLMERVGREGRWLLTRRDVERMGPAPVVVLRITQDRPALQVIEILRSLSYPVDPTRWFSRCLRCNRTLSLLPREEAREMIPEFVAQTQPSFRQCPSCRRVYWPGTHSHRMRSTIEGWVKAASGGEGEGPDHESPR